MIHAPAQIALPSFAVPSLAVAGAVAISIPIIIHILSRRPRKPQPWGAMRFLLAAYRKHRVRTRLEQLLLLLVRCLILFLLGLALAGPACSQLGDLAGLARARTLVIVLDNSVTSGAMDAAGGNRFARLQKAADRLLNAMGPNDRVALVTAGKPATAVISPPTANPSAIRRQIQAIEPVPSAADLPGALRLAMESIEQLEDESASTYVALISDFSAGAVPDGPAAAALPAELKRLGERSRLYMLEPAPSLANVQVAELAPQRRLVISDTAGATPTVTWSLKLRRFAAEASGESMSTVMLQLPEATPVRRTVRWAPGQTTAEMRISTPLNQKGLLTATALLEPGAPGSDTLEADNTRQALVRSRQQLSVVLAGRSRPDADTFTPQNLVTTALAPVADQLGWPLAIKSQDAGALDSDHLQETDVLFVLRPDLLDDRGWTAIKGWVGTGGLAWFFTPPSTTPSLWPQKLADTFDLTWSAKLEGVSRRETPLKLATDAAVAAELMRLRTDLPELIRPIEIYRHLPIDPQSLSLDTDQLLVGVGDEPLLIGASVPSHGRVLLLATAIDPQWTNLPTKPLFVPLLHEVMRAAIDQLQPPADYEVGDRPHLGETWANTARLLDPAGKDLLLVQDRKARGPDGGEETAPSSLSVRPIRPFALPGVYRSETSALTVNVRADAADTTAADPKYLKSWLSAVGEWRQVNAENPATAMLEQQQLADLGWPLLWAVLALALVETFLARSVSHAEVTGRTLDASSLNHAA